MDHKYTDRNERPPDDELGPAQTWVWLWNRPRPAIPRPNEKFEATFDALDDSGHWEIMGLGAKID